MSVDYFGKYFNKDGFDFPSLINDDFVAPIRLLFQHNHYVSAAKLLLTFIDSIGYVEFGTRERNPFVAWLNKYASLDKVGVTAEELWEHRNSLLHMSNLDSRRVVAGKVKRLMLYVGTLPTGMPSEGSDTKYYNLQTLILAVVGGCEQWFDSYNVDRDKIVGFVERYDLIASDSRMLWVNLDSGAEG